MTQKPKRPADMNKLAKSIVYIATGEDVALEKDVNKINSGKAGGAARAKSLTKERRSQIAKKFGFLLLDRQLSSSALLLP